MNYYNRIKKELLNYEITKKVKEYSINKSELITKYNVGKMLIEAQGGETRAKYGNGLIKEYSEKLYKETGLKYNETILKRMRQFYLAVQKGATVSHQLTWSHYSELLSLKNDIQINYYVKICEVQNLSVRQLREKIKQHEYERLPQNTKDKLLKEETNYEITDFVKNPIIIKNDSSIEEVSEKVLQNMILEDIPSFLEQLGEGFTFIKNEYPIKLGNNYNYIDLLLFNYIYNCFVVIELKVTDLKKEHIGQIQIYMNYIDNNLKKIGHDKTIGIIICKKDNKYIIKYSSDKKVISRVYEIMLKDKNM